MVVQITAEGVMVTTAGRDGSAPLTLLCAPRIQQSVAKGALQFFNSFIHGMGDIMQLIAIYKIACINCDLYL